ncbi:ABC transporter substrate-binding protein [Streptomyces sp. NPDC092296]|uniref:ABC transporter substrate-binding protein n=1 Tax=Streptomyces sp. NPDC092296 TaxID=3366012 RepID=UPI0038015C5A
MTLTIGVHAGNPSLYHLSRLPFLDEELAPLGESAQWHRYTDGTRTGALLADGTLDFGGTGSTPPVTAQADGHDIVYAAVSAPRPGHGALLVAADGPVREVADLRGGTVVLGIGSWQTHLLAKALDRAGLSYRHDITAQRPGDADRHPAERLRSGEIAGWIAQEAELAAAQRSGDFRVLLPTSEVITDRSVFFTRRDLAEQRPEVVAAIAAALQRADDWAASHPREAAAAVAADLGGSVEDWETAHRLLPWRLEPVSDAFLAEQQEAADILHGVGFSSRAVRTADAGAPGLRAPVAAALERVAAARTGVEG